MINPVLVLTHNCLELTKKCVASILAQDVPVDLLVYDNGSTDGTSEWLPNNIDRPGFKAWRSQFNLGVSRGWNMGLKYYFEELGAEHVLVVNNDTILPTWFYSSLLSFPGPFFSGISVNTLDEIAEQQEEWPLSSSGPDFSGWLMRKECWSQVGPFDEAMVHYSSDCDYHIRAHRKGIRLMNSGVPFYHERSSTLKLATHRERRRIELQSDADRLVFKSKYGMDPWDPGYAELFSEDQFGIYRK